MTDKPFQTIQEVSYEEFSCLARYRGQREIDRYSKFERYPLHELRRAIADPRFEGRPINYYEVGANVGMSVILASQMLLKRGNVYSFEVEPANYHRLVENIMINHFANSVAFPFGIGEEVSLSSFFINERHLVEDQPRVGEGLHSFHTYANMDGWHSEQHSFKACLLPLDLVIDLFKLPHPTHIFIDAFGSEGEILKGMKRTLSDGAVDTLMVQIEAVGHYKEGETFRLEDNGAYDYLVNAGYKLVGSNALPGILDFLRGYNCIFRGVR